MSATESSETTEQQLWTHVYGAVYPEDHEMAPGGYGTVLAQGSSIPPEHVSRTLRVSDAPGATTYSYLGSFDHEPTDDEMDALIPEEYQYSEPDEVGQGEGYDRDLELGAVDLGVAEEDRW